MSNLKPRRLLPAIAGTLTMFAFGSVSATTLQLDFGVSFGDPGDTDTAQPDGPAPWLTALIDDGDSAGTVTLTLTVAGTVGIADVKSVYLNVDDAIGAENLNIGYSSGQAETSIANMTNTYKPDSDGLMDILITYANNAFTAGESSVFSIDDGGANLLTALSFNFISAPDPGETDPTGPWRAAAKFGSTGSDTVTCNSVNGPIGECSDWVGVAIPVPAAVWLFGSAIGLLGWMRRRVD